MEIRGRRTYPNMTNWPAPNASGYEASLLHSDCRNSRQRLAIKAYRHTAAYDAAISTDLPALVEGGTASRAAAVCGAVSAGVSMAKAR